MRKLALVVLVAGCNDAFQPGVGLQVVLTGDTGLGPTPEVRQVAVADGLVHPLAVASVPGSDLLLVADQTGAVLRVDGGGPELVADLGPLLVPLDPDGDARGLLGLALHPDFPSNGRMFVHYDAPPLGSGDHAATLAELDVVGGVAGAPRTILAVDVPTATDVGGALLFDTTGALLWALGDGGVAGAAQDLSSPLGKVLRLDVDAVPYGIPAGNPLAVPGDLGRPEVWAWGLHDPRGLALTVLAGRDAVLVADRGLALQDEVTALGAGGNAGWPIREGTRCLDLADPTHPPATCAVSGPIGEPLLPPVLALPHPGAPGDGPVVSTVVGGPVVGGALPSLRGALVLGDRAVDPAVASGRLLWADVRPPGDAALWSADVLAVQGGSGTLGAFLLGLGVDGSGFPIALTAETAGPTGTTGVAWRLAPIRSPPEAVPPDDPLPW